MNIAQPCNFLAGQDARDGFNILTRLRRSGLVHMYTAAPLLMDELGVTQAAAERLIKQWHRQQEKEPHEPDSEQKTARPPRISA